MFKDIPPCLVGDVISMLHLFDTILSTQLWFLTIGGMAYPLLTLQSPKCTNKTFDLFLNLYRVESIKFEIIDLLHLS